MYFEGTETLGFSLCVWQIIDYNLAFLGHVRKTLAFVKVTESV